MANIALPHHAKAVRRTPGQQFFFWLVRPWKWHFLLMFLSDHGSAIIKHNYDAHVTDYMYDRKPSGRGLLGRFVDKLVLNQDTQIALPQRLRIVSDMLADTAATIHRESNEPVHVVSGPCGLARDFISAHAALKQQGMIDDDSRWLRFTGVDLDASETVLATAQQRIEASAIHANDTRFAKIDLLDRDHVLKTLGEQSADVFLSMGLTVWLNRDQRQMFFQNVHDVTKPGGYLIIDWFKEHKASNMLEDFQMVAWYPPLEQYLDELKAAGFTLVDQQATSNDVNTILRLRRMDRKI